MVDNNTDVSRVLRSKQEARSAYNKLSPWYDLLAHSSEKKYQEEGLRKLGVREGESVLDIGFGTGHAIIALAQAVGPTGRIYGIDISQGMLKITRARVEKSDLSDRVELRLGDATQLPYEADFCDAVFMSFTLELFDTPDIPLLLQQCRRVLRHGGRIGVVALSKKPESSLMVKLYEWAHRRFPDYADCRPIYVQRSLEGAGFCIVDVNERSMWGLPVDVVVARNS